MYDERKLDTSKSLMALAKEGWTLNEVFAAFGIQPIDEQEVAKNKPRKEELVQRITEVMHDLGVPSNLNGFKYLRRAIEMAVEDMDVMKLITVRLYPIVAEEFGSTPGRVEHSMRHAIESAWNYGDIDMQEKYFSFTIRNYKSKPTNSEFITTIADSLCLEGYGPIK